MKINFIISLITTVVVLFFYVVFDLGEFIYKVIPPDTINYIKASNMLYNDLTAHPTRPIGYAFISGLPNLFCSSLSNNGYILFGILLNFISWVVSIVFFFKTTSLFFSHKFSFLITLIPIFTLGSIFSVFWMLTEPITILMLSLISYNLSKYIINEDIKHLIVATSLLNLAILVRPGFIYLGLVASFTLIIFLIKNFKRIMSKTALMGFGVSLIFIAFQYGMMYKTYGKATPSFIDKLTWYHYLGAKSQAEAEGIPLNSIKELRRLELSGKSFKEKSQISSADIKRQVKENTYIVFKHWTLNIVRNSISGSGIIASMKKENQSKFLNIFSTLLFRISQLQNTFFTLVFCFSIFFLVKNKFNHSIAIFLLAAIVAYIIITSGISFSQGDRFHHILYQSIILIFLLSIKDKAYAQQWLKQH